jgi:hypothetical protein
MEIWKEIDGNYEVSNTGLVRNKKTKKVLKQNGRTVLLSYNGLDKRFSVSRLVAFAFIENPKPNEYNVVMHIDDNPSNNNVSNLKWGTQKMNIHDMISKGRSKRILTDMDVIDIRAMHPLKSYSQIANIFGVSKSAIAPIIQNKRYKNI